MIWSFGPDRQMHSMAHALDLQESYEDADGRRTNKNTDNILGWR